MTWYAPSVKNSVKGTYSSRQSNGQPSNDILLELVKWEPAPAR